jgi:hypothetical protein
MALRVSNVQVILNLPVYAITLRSTPSRQLRRVSFTNPFTIVADTGPRQFELTDGET